jgi:zinc/manganese transport system ATP-binding protein
MNTKEFSAIRTRQAGLAFGSRVLWQGLDLDIAPGQFVAILGSNGSGKTSLLKVLLGEQPLTSGQAWVAGEPVSRGSTAVGYVPQKVSIDEGTMLKARDLVRMGLDGHRWGFPLGSMHSRRAVRTGIDNLLASVGATGFGDAPVSMLSGGELQRVRVAAALASNPSILLCDEPLAALDLRHQQEVAALLDRRRREHGTAVLFVTHDINAVLDYVDLVLYLAAGQFRLGPPSEVLTSRVLTELYGAPVDVLHAQGRLIVVASNDPSTGHHLSDDDCGVPDHSSTLGALAYFDAERGAPVGAGGSGAARASGGSGASIGNGAVPAAPGDPFGEPVSSASSVPEQGVSAGTDTDAVPAVRRRHR